MNKNGGGVRKGASFFCRNAIADALCGRKLCVRAKSYGLRREAECAPCGGAPACGALAIKRLACKSLRYKRRKAGKAVCGLARRSGEWALVRRMRKCKFEAWKRVNRPYRCAPICGRLARRMRECGRAVRMRRPACGTHREFMRGRQMRISKRPRRYGVARTLARAEVYGVLYREF